jgi:hypothetical protein
MRKWLRAYDEVRGWNMGVLRYVYRYNVISKTARKRKTRTEMQPQRGGPCTETVVLVEIDFSRYPVAANRGSEDMVRSSLSTSLLQKPAHWALLVSRKGVSRRIKQHPRMDIA